MAGVNPANQAHRAGIREEPFFEQSWMSVPFESYEGKNQGQYQEAVSPFLVHGNSVPTDVPNGWRRVETRPGKNIYVHMNSGAISRFPKEIYDCKRACWVAKDGTEITQQELSLHPDRRVLNHVGGKQRPVQAASIISEPRRASAKNDAQEGSKDDFKQAGEETAEQSSNLEVAALKIEPPLPVALTFPGQGSQHVKMLEGVKNLPAVREMLRKAERILGYDLLDICLNGPEEKLEQTRYCQPAMFVAGLAGVEKLRFENPDKVARCQAVAGLSLGEYTALVVAGVFDFETGLRIVKVRAEAMQEAAEASPQSMLSVAGLSEEVLHSLCQESCEHPEDVCAVANELFPNGFACAGTKKAVDRLHAKAQNTPGIVQAKILKTSGGFHTSLMNSAKVKLLSMFQDVEKNMHPPRCAVYMNVTGRKIDATTKPSEILGMLVDQMVSSVRWMSSVQAMEADGVQEFFECGPNKQLTSMLKRTNQQLWKNAKTIPV